jgi:hypothetical protein
MKFYTPQGFILEGRQKDLVCSLLLQLAQATRCQCEPNGSAAQIIRLLRILSRIKGLGRCIIGLSE